MVIAFTMPRTLKDFKMPRLQQAIVEGSAVHFLVIFTSHFVLEMFLLFARVSVSLVEIGGSLKILLDMSKTFTGTVSAGIGSW